MMMAYARVSTLEQADEDKVSISEQLRRCKAIAELRGETEAPVDFGGIRWVKYRGAVGGTQMIHPDEAYVIPMGVPGLALGRFAPGDWLDTVNTIGLPGYAVGKIREDNKGVDIEMQSNPLHLLTRPRAVIKLTRV